MSTDPAHIQLMKDVAEYFLPAPNENLSSKDELRYGTKGSMHVDLTKGTWYDHENNEGGGAIALIMREQGIHEPRDAYAWAENNGFWTNSKANGSTSGGLGPIAATYNYTDENDVLLFQVLRYDQPEKTFRQRRPDGNDWNYSVKGVRRVPYALPGLIEAVGKQQTIYICEGEKDCNNLHALSLAASTNPGGANKWQDALTPYFKGADVVVIADNDEAGRKHVADVAAKLTGTAKRIRVLDVGAVWPECPVKGDISDWLAKHKPEALGGIVAGLADWKPQSLSALLGVLDAGDDYTKPAPRAWLYGNLFARKFLSSLFGDGGVGKTAVRYAQYLSLAIGRDLVGGHVFQRCRVLIISLEDDMDELRRRIWALRIHYNIGEAELKGWLFLWTPGAKGGKLMELDQHGNLKAGELSANLETLIIEYKLDLVGIDPFIKSHGVGENDNNAIDLVAQVLVDLMHKHDISVDIPHHVSKGMAAEPGDANRGRGASALKDAARLVYTLNVMTTKEAEAFGLPEHERYAYIRLDKGKVNIAPPARKAIWFHLVGVKLGNQNEMYQSGDEVQVVETWEAPQEARATVTLDQQARMMEAIKTREAWRKEYPARDWI